MCLWTTEDKYKEKILYTGCTPIFWLSKVTLAVLGYQAQHLLTCKNADARRVWCELNCNSDVSQLHQVFWVCIIILWAKAINTYSGQQHLSGRAGTVDAVAAACRYLGHDFLNIEKSQAAY